MQKKLSSSSKNGTEASNHYGLNRAMHCFEWYMYCSLAFIATLKSQEYLPVSDATSIKILFCPQAHQS